METVGFVGVGKIGLPISENLIKSGYRVLGYRRGSLADFEKIGGVAGEVAGRDRRAVRRRVLLRADRRGDGRGRERAERPDPFGAARPDHRRARLASGAGQGEARRAARQEGRGLSRRRGQRHARHGGGAQGRDLSRRRRRRRARRSSRSSRALPICCLYFGPFGAASKVKLVNNLLVAINIAAAAEAMALGLKAGVDIDADDQGGRQRQRRLDPVRHPRAVDGAAQVPAGAGLAGAAVALLRHDRRLGRLDRRRDAAASTAPSSSTSTASTWVSPTTTTSP